MQFAHHFPQETFFLFFFLSFFFLISAPSVLVLFSFLNLFFILFIYLTVLSLSSGTWNLPCSAWAL